MAADLTGSGEASEPTPATTAPATAAAPRSVPMQPILLAPRANRVRFTLIYAFLGIVVVGAFVALGIFATRSINPAPKWSAWRPTGGGQGAAHQIADHVAQQYRLPNGDQLVDVISKAPSITPSTSTLPVHFVAVRGVKGAADQVYPVSSTNSVMYSLCGLGTSCEIASGKPSIERGRLVRREILELALYTFKYVGGIQSVIAFMPATPGKTTKYVVFLRPSDLTAELKQPLATTLEKNVPLPAAIPAREVHTIDDTTGPRYYTFSGVAQAPQGDLVFVLAPIPA